jgi:hypothetical protein
VAPEKEDTYIHKETQERKIIIGVVVCVHEGTHAGKNTGSGSVMEAIIAQRISVRTRFVRKKKASWRQGRSS